MPELPTGTVTLLFTDIEGSTRLLQQLGDRYASMLAECRHLLRATFQEWNGNVVDTQGDAFFVAFARATDAVLAVVEVQRALAAHPWPDGVAVHVRMGLHTGEPQRSVEGYVGLDVHHAARIMSAGHGGQVLLSQSTRDLVEHALPEGVHLQDLGARRLKDLQQPSHLFQLVISGLSADFPPLKTLDSSPNNLPVQPTPFLGRGKEVHALQQLLWRESSHLVTLTGPGGVGKTRLALQAAAELSEHFPDGTWFVSLAPISDPDLVIPTISQALGLREARDQTPLQHVKHALQEKKTLLLLDNFEQVVSAALSVADLLAGCPRLKVLVTSREGLHLRAEREFHVPALALPDPRHPPDLLSLSQYEAVALFIERAQAVTPEFQVTNTNALAVAEICMRLDGLPLAIELAAARIRLFPPQALLTRLGQRLPLLTSSVRDVPARQQTLRNTIEWSYQLLDAKEQRLFRRVSVFVDGCTLEAIEAICASLDADTEAGQVLEGVASLIDKSLLQQTEHEEGEPRLTMLETIREYGLEVLAASGELEATQKAHADYYLSLGEEAEPELAGPQQAMWLERLEREYGNLRATLRWSLQRGEIEQGIEVALRLAGALRRFWEVRGHWSEGWSFLARALAESKEAARPVQLKALKAAAHLAYVQGDIDRAEALSQECLARCRELGDRAGIAFSLRLLGLIAMRRCNFGVAYSRTKESLALYREVGDKEGTAWSLNNLGYIVSDQGEYTRAISLKEEALALFEELGNIEGIANSLSSLAWVFFISEGDPAKVRTLLEKALALCREMGHKDDTIFVLRFLGEVCLQQGDKAKARLLLEEGLVLSREMGFRHGIAQSLSVLGRVEALDGDYAAARAFYEECLGIGKEVGDNLSIAFYLEGLAYLVAVQGDPVWAARLWGVAEALREAMGTPLPPVNRTAYQRSVSATRAQLGEKAFAAAWTEGWMMTPEQALAAQGKAMRPTPISTRLASTPLAESPTSPAGLTAREVEVLRLLTTGLTDAQIAEQLVISPRTVHNHLTSIYSKIQVSSRSAATRYAIEHHLD